MTLHMLYRYVCKVCWDIYCGGTEMTLHMLYGYVCKVCFDIYCDGGEMILHMLYRYYVRSVGITIVVGVK